MSCESAIPADAGAQLAAIDLEFAKVGDEVRAMKNSRDSQADPQA
jgi:hypothetical protein